MTPPARQRPRYWLLPVLLAACLLAAALTTDLPYYALAPGDARQVDELLRVPAELTFPPRGDVLLATVSLQRVKPLDALRAWLDRDIEVVPEERILGNTPPARYRQQNLQLMDDSKQNAIVVALRRLGHEVTERGAGTEVVEVVPGHAADGRLQSGDVITGVDGMPTLLVQDAIARLRARRPGEVVRLEVTDPAGSRRAEEIVLGDDGQGRPLLGVSLRTKNRHFDMPFEIDIDSGRIGGPSAGLAFTLALIDTLSPGELTGGVRVAATGTIEIDGRVGDVGGVTQKTAAVHAAGARYFFVPPGEYEEARVAAGDRLTVVKVATLDEALAALGRAGGDLSALAPAARGGQG